MSITIRSERPDSADAMGLIQELEAILSPMYPDESRHGYSVNKLIEQEVRFFVVRSDGEAAGCAGIQFFNGNGVLPYGEVKRMYVRPSFRGLGLAKLLLEQLEAAARIEGVEILRLETGIHQKAAIRLYEHAGFERTGPFGDYRDDPLSRYYERRIELATGSDGAGRG